MIKYKIVGFSTKGGVMETYLQERVENFESHRTDFFALLNSRVSRKMHECKRGFWLWGKYPFGGKMFSLHITKSMLIIDKIGE